MKERSILFSAPMVRALLAGTKTQTRRIVKAEHLRTSEDPGRVLECLPDRFMKDAATLCPHGGPGDRLWVQESYHVVGHGSVGPAMTVKYLADDAVRTVDVSPATYEKYRARKTSSALGGRFMYRDISRIALELTAVRVERLQDISEPDAIAEGIERVGGGRYWLGAAGLNPCGDPVAAYRSLWESINGPGSWAANPWVWVETFKRISP